MCSTALGLPAQRPLLQRCYLVDKCYPHRL